MCFSIALLVLLKKHSETFERKAVKYLRGLGFNSVYQKPITAHYIRLKHPYRAQSFSSELFKFPIQPHHYSFMY